MISLMLSFYIKLVVVKVFRRKIEKSEGGKKIACKQVI